MRDAADRIGALAEQALARTPASVGPLAGDASTRSYWRATFDDGAEPATVVGMVMPEGERLTDDHDYVRLQRALSAVGVPVAAMHAIDADGGLALLEDLGDERMQARLETCDADERAALYAEAIDILATFHTADYAATGLPNPATAREFTIEKYTEEWHDFVDSYLAGHLGLDLGETRKKLDSAFLMVTRYVTTPTVPFVPLHRDYHVRNLMVTDAGLRLVDFQDARMGLPEYDLASLLRDAYWVLEDDERETLRQRYIEKTGMANDKRAARSNLQRFEWCALQRNLKAIGTFARLAELRLHAKPPAPRSG